MCGLVGMAGAVTHSHLSVFKDMLDVCQVRGRDSTGAVRVKPDNEYLWAKMAGPPSVLLDTKTYDKMIDTAPAKALIGHCRAKTIGEAKTRNAHPFDFPGKLIGVHNGTLRAYHNMEKYRDFEVDSELLYWHIAEYGLQETITNLSDDGAWALVYWNAQDNTLNFIRNDKRPLFFTHSEDKKVMFWASEPWMFNVISRKMKLWDGEGNSVFYPLPENTHYKFTIDSTKHKPSEIFTLHQPVEIKGEVRSYSGNSTNVHGYSGSRGVHHGGSVARPFPRPGDNLDDNLTDLTSRVNASRGLLPPPLETTQSQGGSTHTTGTSVESSNSSPKPSDSKTDSRNTPGTSRQRLSLVETRSNVPPQENSGKSTSTSTGCSTTLANRQSPVKLVSFRSVLGQNYITNNKDGSEYLEGDFDEQTKGCCSFCKSPIGALDEVNEIFHLVDMMGQKELAFICTSCIVPAVA